MITGIFYYKTLFGCQVAPFSKQLLRNIRFDDWKICLKSWLHRNVYYKYTIRMQRWVKISKQLAKNNLWLVTWGHDRIKITINHTNFRAFGKETLVLTVEKFAIKREKITIKIILYLNPTLCENFKAVDWETYSEKWKILMRTWMIKTFTTKIHLHLITILEWSLNNDLITLLTEWPGVIIGENFGYKELCVQTIWT